MPHNMCVKLTTASLLINVKLLYFSGGWGPKPQWWQMFQQISLYNEKLGQICRKGCFFKKHTDFKEMSCGICNIYGAVPVRQAGLQPSGASHAIIGACSAVTGTTSGLQQASQDILKELLRCLKLWFYRAVGKETGCIQELMCFGSHISSSVTAEGPTPRGNLRDTLGLSFSIHFACSVGLRWGLGRWSWKGSKIRNTSHQSMKTTYSFSARISQGMHLCKNLTPISWFWIVFELETK